MGLITKGIGGFYYVKTEDGIIECKGKGTFKNDGIKLQVGDTVDIEKVPLSALPENENQKISWWWLLIIAILGTTGEEMYRRNREKKERATIKSDDNK